jgi:hypothetical protein
MNMSASTSSFCFGAAVPKLDGEVLARQWLCTHMTQQKERSRPATEAEKRELTLKLKEFYESAAPGVVQHGVGVLRRFGISEQVLSKLTNLEDFSASALADPKLTVQDVKHWTDFMRKVQGEGPRIFKNIVREMVRGFPRLPGGGRPGVTDEKKQAARKEVLELLSKGGIRMSVALRRVARNHGISYRTMQRIWAQPQDKFPEKG